MSNKSKTTSTDLKDTLRVASNETDYDKLIAKTTLQPSVQAGLTIKQWSKRIGDNDLSKLIDELRTQSDVASNGYLGRGEAMLVAQAHTLDAIFNELARRAGANMNQYPNVTDSYMRLALKAQSQCRTTIEALAEIKNPRPVAFVKQANIANNQQVNNGPQPSTELSDQYARAPATAREIETEPNKLLEAQHGQRVDSGTTTTTGGIDSRLEAVGAINRTEDEGRQSGS